MKFGRLIRLRTFGNDPKSVAYIVAVSDSAKAVDIIRNNAAIAGDEIEDLCGVSEALLKSLNLLPGDFVRADAPRRYC